MTRTSRTVAVAPRLREILTRLLEESEDGRKVSLDALGDAIGTLAITPQEIDELIGALEAEGREVGSAEAARGEALLRVVLATARALRDELGRPPRPDEIAARAAIPIDDVRHALALAGVMQR
jgi:hypothetical protein